MTSHVESMINKQIDIVQAFIFAPRHLSKYVHYRDGQVKLRFKNSSISDVVVPIIPYNDPELCCILNSIKEPSKSSPAEISSISLSNETCLYQNVKPLGPRGAVGVPYIVTVNNNTMIAKLTTLDGVYSKYLKDPPSKITGYPSSQIITRNCLVDIRVNNIKYIASDEFTNETLIAYILNYLAHQQSIPPLFVRHYQAAICDDPTTGESFGLNLMENCDLGPLDKLSNHPDFASHVFTYNVNDAGSQKILQLVEPETILQILTQITVGLHSLQTFINFTSGDLKAGNIFVKSDSIDTRYMGIPIIAPFTCKIADYGKSSCMLYKGEDHGIRFYNDSPLANVYLSLHPFENDIIRDDGEYFYSISSILNVQLYTRTRHMGIPFYHSFDYYTVIVSILTHPAFYYPFFATDYLRKIFWDPIWKYDGPTVMEKIKVHVDNGTGSSINDALDILKGVSLRCNAVQTVIQQLQMHYMN